MPSRCFHDVLNDITLVEEGGALFVRQAGHSYLALRWKLTQEVVAVVQTALRFGLPKLWQTGHPQGRHSSHISFSSSHEPGSWVFALGLEARPPRLQRITFSKRFLGVFESSSLAWARQKGGGGNIFVPPDELVDALTALRGHYGEREKRSAGAIDECASRHGAAC